METMDPAHQMTENQLKQLEQRILRVYSEARDDLRETINDYFESFRKRDEEMKKIIGTIQNGKEWTEKDYKQWRLNQIGRGKRFEALKNKIAERMTKANETAIAYVNDQTPGVYSLNRNYAAYTIERVYGDVGFTLWDENTVRQIITNEPNLMPYYPNAKAVKRGIDLQWGKQQIIKSVTQGVLQGKSIGKIATDLQSRVSEMNRASAVRAARTAVTGAQNAGRMDSYHAAEKMGIKLKKEWIATLDARTRHSHAVIDGEVKDVDAKFSNGCRFPGDPQGKPVEIYNCRCTLIAAMDGVDTSDAQRWARNSDTGRAMKVENMTYAQWAGWKKGKTFATFENTFGISKKFAEGMQITLESSVHGVVKDIYARYQNEIRCVNNKESRGAYFLASDGGIHFNEKDAQSGSKYQMPYQVAFHEFGHNIDWILGGKNNLEYASMKEYNGVKLIDVIKSDYKAFRKSLGIRNHKDFIEHMQSENIPLIYCGNISDVLEGITNISYPLGIGHGKDYHKRNGATAKEFFAEVLDSAAANQGSFNQMKRIFPNAVQMVFDIIGGVI